MANHPYHQLNEESTRTASLSSLCILTCMTCFKKVFKICKSIKRFILEKIKMYKMRTVMEIIKMGVKMLLD